jgi:hypothetical protein
MINLPKLFPLGNLYSTPGVLEAIPEDDVSHAFARHQSGDWGEVCDEDKLENEFSLVRGSRIMSAYRSSTGMKFWIITEANRMATTALLPEEY